MMTSGSNQILFVIVASLACLCEVWAISCIVCQNCAESYDANSTRACGKKEDRCIKMILVTDEVDRGCGDVAKCTGRAPTRKPRSLAKQPKSKPEELTNYAPKQRTIRQLLAPPSNGGDGKQTNTVEIAAMFCCEGDECNSAPNIHGNYHYFILLLLLPSIYSLLVCTPRHDQLLLSTNNH